MYVQVFTGFREERDCTGRKGLLVLFLIPRIVHVSFRFSRAPKKKKTKEFFEEEDGSYGPMETCIQVGVSP